MLCDSTTTINTGTVIHCIIIIRSVKSIILPQQKH